MPSTVLLDHVLRERWPQVVERLVAHPYEVHYREYGSTALHWACSREPPIEVVTTMLTVYPKAALVQDFNGRTALHLASFMSHRSSSKIVRALLEVNMDATNVEDRCGRNPLHFMFSSHELKISEALKKHKRPNQTATSFLAESNLREFWAKTCLLARASLQIEHPEEFTDGPILHVLLKLKQCPSKILRLALKLYPQHLLKTDERGNTPLHIAAAANNDTFLVILSSFCAEYPETAQLRNSEGHSALDLAIQSGKMWDRGIRNIVEAHPLAVTKQDSGSGLFPFMMAAVEQRTCLATVYFLLRACPELWRFLLVVERWKDGTNDLCSFKSL